MHPPPLSTGHPGLDSALSGLGYGPASRADAIPPLLIVLPTAVSPESVARCLRLAMSAWSIDYHQWDARGTELQPVLDVWQPHWTSEARTAIASRWAQGDGTRILIANAPIGFDTPRDMGDASSLAWLLHTAPVHLAEAGDQVLILLLDAATQLPLPSSGVVTRTSSPLFGPASPLGPPGGVVVVRAFKDGSYSVVSHPQPVLMPSPPHEAWPLPQREVKRKRSLSEEAEGAYTDHNYTRDRKKISSCSYQNPTMPPSRHACHAHPPSSSLSYIPPASQW